MLKGMLKRALAGMAAAVLAAAGLAGLAGAASAATITITDGGANNGVIDGHSFKYVKIASYTDYVNGEYTGLSTMNGAAGSNEAKVYSAVVSAVNAVFGEGSVPAADVDPLVWAQGVNGQKMGDNSAFPWNDDANSRQFAQHLVDTLDTAENTGLWTSAGVASNGQLEIRDLANGLYLIVDTTEDVMNATSTLPMLVSTAENNATVVVKNQRTNTPPTKTVTGDSNHTVTQGQQVEFTIEGEVPATAGANDDYAYVFTDYANDGIEIDLDTVKVYYGNSNPMTEITEGFTVAVDGAVATQGQKVTGSKSNTVDTPTADATFTVSIPKTTLDSVQSSAGQPLVVKYTATVTTTVTTVDNWATVTSGENTSTPGHAPTLTTTDLQFTKVGDGGAALDGVQFTIARKDGAQLPSGYPTTAESTNGGVVKFPNLADGTYTITEGTPKEGYFDLGLSFDVTITTTNGVANIEISNESASKWGGLNYDLVTQDATSGAITVQNIMKITQLPLTGAAGTMLFTVLGLLIAGAGVTVYMKSRSVKHALRG
ncbi:isopeptide-forming domain-containing fimbrial protein [Bifidobacterium saeculare]|uniref:SpaA isopeptide-forming pilin-related protein n=1 Tax=Bifidobacterium pullorum TaxID=78448 RepID=UPI001875B377|nr:isopeptide-forming domain-containing fimbrial protein [Bifidobacterium pullorum]MBE5064655.1 isopeptide-forming domain-containing fimbrial protein [Bifidobacterium pullorum subsp. saeculare]